MQVLTREELRNSLATIDREQEPARYNFLHELLAFLDSVAATQHARDVEWTRALGITDKVLAPEDCAKWLEADRVVRARNVSDARQRRGPVHW